jgi:hypothetical protein
VTAKAVATYSVAETMTGELRYKCNSIGYAIPADTQLTNPLQTASDYRESSVIEQAEPNGLFSSKNTDGTWVLCVSADGVAYPYYSEHKIQTWPFPVERNPETGEWTQVANTTINVEIDTTEISKEIEIRINVGGDNK